MSYPPPPKWKILKVFFLLFVAPSSYEMCNLHPLQMLFQNKILCWNSQHMYLSPELDFIRFLDKIVDIYTVPNFHVCSDLSFLSIINYSLNL